LKKKQGKEKPGMIRLTRQEPVKNPVVTRRLFFLLKRRRFDLKKKLTRANWTTRSKPGTRALDRTRSENYVINASAGKYYKTICLVIVYVILFNNVWYGMF
jgi:hypothetical protein